jgi:DNA helicase HerA-like ATPase
MRADPTLLGTVQDVRGATVSVALSEETISGISFVEGHGYRIGQVGSFVRIPLGYVDLFGIVSEVGAGAVPERVLQQEPYGRRWMTVQLVGEGHRRGDFKRGLSQYPTIGDRVHLVTERDLERIYGRPDEPRFIRVGHLASAESIPALIDIDKLLTRHSAVVGATGAGKSTTVAGILASLSDPGRYPSARALVIDIHGEYAAALSDRATVFRVNPSSANECPLHVPYWAMTSDELLSVTLEPLDDTGRGAVMEKIMALKLSALDDHPREGVTAHNLTPDTPVPFSIHRLWFDLHRLVNATHTQAGGQSEATEALLLDDSNEPVERGDPLRVLPPKYMPHTQAAGQPKIFLSTSTLNIRRSLDGLGSKLRDPRFDFLFRPGPWYPSPEGVPESDLDVLLASWVGGQRPVTILDLSGVPVTVLTHVVGVVLRIIYDALFWGRNLAEGGRERPLLIVLEEAHSYLGSGDTGPAAHAVRRIVKEGRKYGIGAMIVSQRPAEIDMTVLSQCGTLFAMRLSNPTDRGHVTGAVTDNLEGLLSMLPVLRTGEAVVIGEAVHLPVRTLLDPPSRARRPDSTDPLVYDAAGPGGWNRQRETSSYAELVRVWRSQNPRSPRAVPTLVAAQTETGEEHAAVQRVPVASTNVASIGYDPPTQTLEVEFHGGRVYQYFDVPVQVYEGFMSAPSKGQFLQQSIKGLYRHARL